MTQAYDMAIQAIFQLQFNSKEAIQYVMRNGRVDHETAKKAIRACMLFYKK